MLTKPFFKILFLFIFICLNGCSEIILFHPKGYVGIQEKSLIIISAALMLIVVLPALVMTIIFAYRYRQANTKAKYNPDWSSSFKLEMAFWLVPLFIISSLSILVWHYTHKLDPYQPLKSTKPAMTIQVISFDWKWLFIYPEQHIATVNEIVLPIDTPIHFFLTSATVMNSFFIPQLGSQIMTMAGMQTQLNLIANTPGTYQGLSANFSGLGFSGMKFKAIVSSEAVFKNWVKTIKRADKSFSLNNYKMLKIPSLNNPVEYFSYVPPNLFHMVVTDHGSITQ